LGIVVNILSGGYSSYFVYKIYESKKYEIEQSIDNNQKRIETMKIVGGFNSWVPWLAIVMATIILINLVLIVLPKFSHI
jgi:hypothetical protein